MLVMAFGSLVSYSPMQYLIDFIPKQEIICRVYIMPSVCLLRQQHAIFKCQSFNRFAK